MIAVRNSLAMARPNLNPLELLASGLNELQGYGMIHTGLISVRGAGLLFYYPDQARGIHRLAIGLTPVEWQEQNVPTPPTLLMKVTLEAGNGWIRAHIPVWGWVGMIPADETKQKLLMSVRVDTIFMVAKLVKTDRRIVIQFEEGR